MTNDLIPTPTLLTYLALEELGKLAEESGKTGRDSGAGCRVDRAPFSHRCLLGLFARAGSRESRPGRYAWPSQAGRGHASSVGAGRSHRPRRRTRSGPVLRQSSEEPSTFKYFSEAGEDAYQSFLGVPLIDRGVLQGVLVVQTTEERSFGDEDIRLLTDAATQVAPVVSQARTLDRF